MATTLDQIIKELETAASAPAAEKTASAAQTTAAPAASTTASPELDAMQKRAADLDSEGRIIARAFVDEIQKIAVEVTGITPNTGAVPSNPAVQVSNDGEHEADVAKVEAIIKKLTLGGEAKVNPTGAIFENNMPVATTQPIVVDEHPIAADAAKASEEKSATASEEILNTLYDKWFQD